MALGVCEREGCLSILYNVQPCMWAQTLCGHVNSLNVVLDNVRVCAHMHGCTLYKIERLSLGIVGEGNQASVTY